VALALCRQCEKRERAKRIIAAAAAASHTCTFCSRSLTLLSIQSILFHCNARIEEGGGWRVMVWR
jgi:hypothetical protein